MRLFVEQRECRDCGHLFVVTTEPYLCARCASALEWETHIGEPLPLSHNDKKFLKALRIKTEE